jgi:cytochrome P450
MKMQAHGKALVLLLFFCSVFSRLHAAEAPEPVVTPVSYRASLQLFWNNMFDPYRLFKSMFDRYGEAGKPIYFYMPSMGNTLLVYDPVSLQQINKLETKGGILKKGFSVRFISRRLLGSGFAVLEEGDLYSQVHRIMKPQFIQKKIESHLADTQEWVQAFFSHLKNCEKKQEVLDLEEEMLTFAMGGISRSMLGFPLEIEKAKELSRALSRLLTQTMAEQFSFNPFLLSPSLPEQEEGYQTIAGFLEEMIAHNQREEGVQNPYSELIAQIMKATNLSKKEKRDQILNIFFGGHETTAHWLTVCLYFLSLHQDSPFVDQIREEAAAFHTGEKSLSELPYLDAFTEEALRLDPSVPFYGREAMESFDLNGFEVPVGTRILISPFAAHRWQGNWADADAFKPERFLASFNESEEKKRIKERDEKRFIPFGIGKRSCMGRHFSGQEVKLFLLSLLAEGGRVTFQEDCKLNPKMVCTARFRTTAWGRISFQQ